MAESKPLGRGGVFTTTASSALKAALDERLREAECLRTAGFSGMALALRLYALEIRIKILICEHLGLDFLPSACKTHDLSILIAFSGRFRELEGLGDSDAIRLSWDRLEAFSRGRLNDLRYESGSSLTPADLDELFVALDDPIQGVVAWLSK